MMSCHGRAPPMAQASPAENTKGAAMPDRSPVIAAVGLPEGAGILGAADDEAIPAAIAGVNGAIGKPCEAGPAIEPQRQAGGSGRVRNRGDIACRGDHHAGADRQTCPSSLHSHSSKSAGEQSARAKPAPLDASPGDARPMPLHRQGPRPAPRRVASR